MESTEAARARLCDPAYEVSAHWLISEQGAVEALVDEAHRAWHAGAGYWAGQRDINSLSIGIELANPATHPFPEPQMQALIALLRQIMARWNIPPHRVLGHSDTAPGRKIDPGPRFDWVRLAREGVAIWPEAHPLPPQAELSDFCAALVAAGYDPEVPPEVLLAAFRLRFRPWGEGALSRAEMAMALALARMAPAP